MNLQEIFADGISGIHITQGLIRIDFMTLQPHLQSENGQPVVNISQRLIMPLDRFIEAVALQQNAVEQLIKAGVVQPASVSDEAADSKE